MISRIRSSFFLTLLASSFCGCLGGDEPEVAPAKGKKPVAAQLGGWEKIKGGLEIGRFQLPESKVGDSVVTIVRIDMAQVQMKVLTAAEAGHEKLPADEWAERYDLDVVVNAGMFDLSDHSTHVGFLKTPTAVNQGEVHPEYFSVLAFDPSEPGYPQVKIYDTDETDFANEILPNFNGAIQNLRLIKRPGENRWTKQEKFWSECAIGQDGEGRVLLIFCRSPYRMYDLNNFLLELPIDLKCAHHLEGGPEASLVVRDHQPEALHLIGSYETGFNESDDNAKFWPIPNVIGFKVRPTPGDKD